jgi:hypothetical protein
MGGSFAVESVAGLVWNTQFDKLDRVFMFFIHFTLITDALISVNTP